MDHEMKQALAEGLVDALGFIAGALAGAMAARALGFDFMAEDDWGGTSIAGIVLVGLGAGLGKAGARRLLRRAPATPSAATPRPTRKS